MNILRYKDNGIEFFTIQATGESGMSQSGLARLCGVGKEAISKLVNSVVTSSCPPFLKPLQGKDLLLRTSVDEFKNANILKDFVCAKILEWYAFESQRTNDIARQSFRKFAVMGIRSWIQNITGWQHLDNISSPQSSESHLENITIASTKIPDLAEILAQVNQLEHDIFVALKHRHAIHNIVEQPTVIDLSLNRIIHTAVHVQAETLNQALGQLDSLRIKIRQLQAIISFFSQKELLLNTISQLNQTIDHLQQKNLDLTRQSQNKTQRLQILAQRRGSNCTVLIDSHHNVDLILKQRIKELTDLLMKQQKRQGGSRALKTCNLRATMLARYELGDSLQIIADSLGYPYETVKSYVKLARKAIKTDFS